MTSQLDGQKHVMTRLHPVKRIGWRPEVEPPPLLNRAMTCRCSRCHRGFVPYAVKKVIVLAMDAPLPLLRHRVQNLHGCDQRQARSLCLSLSGADRLRERFGLLEQTSPRLLLLRLQGRPVLLEITKVLLRRNGTTQCRL